MNYLPKFAQGSEPARAQTNTYQESQSIAQVSQNQSSGKDGKPVAKGLVVDKSWPHFIAGGVGGATSAVLTCPLDVLRTRLQSETYQAEQRARHAANPLPPRTGALRIPRAAWFHLKETGQGLVDLYKFEGFRALFKGLGANLIGVVPARSTNFFVYGNGKRILNNYFNEDGHLGESPWQIHVAAAVVAGIATGTATNPIWLIKTRMQLDRNRASDDPLRSRQYRNSWDCIKQTVRHEGIRGLYKGLTASYLGVTESTMQWVMYEQFKGTLTRRQQLREANPNYERTVLDKAEDFAGMFTAASGAKLIASALTYPHEVVRTRLRQAPVVTSASGKPVVKYTSLIQCFKLIAKEEGMAGLYGGMTPHLLRVAPSSGLMFVVYEAMLRILQPMAQEKKII